MCIMSYILVIYTILSIITILVYIICTLPTMFYSLVPSSSTVLKHGEEGLV